MRLDFDAVGAYAVVEWEEKLSSTLAVGWSMQRACAVPVDDHMNGLGAARNPSWINLGGVEIEKIGATLKWRPRLQTRSVVTKGRIGWRSRITAKLSQVREY